MLGLEMTSPPPAVPRALTDPHAAADYIADLLGSLSQIAREAQLAHTGALMDMAAMLARLEAQAASGRGDEDKPSAAAAAPRQRART